MTLRKKLVISLLAACLVPLTVVGLVSTQMAKNAMQAQAFNQLESLREVKRGQIEDYFEQIRNQAITFSEDAMIVDAVREFRSSFKELVEESGLSPIEIANQREAVLNYYTNEFGAEYAQRNNTRVDVTALTPTTSAPIIAQYKYIAANPNPLGNKEALDSAGDGTRYSRTHAIYHPRIRNYLQKFEYYDIFLLDPDTGTIVYSVFKELDFATSLTTGPYRNTNFARAFEQARTLGPGDSTILVDFEPYLPSYEAAASFIASPIYDGAELAGVLIFQMPVGKINAIMQERTGLGESGETYLIGSDKLMRSQSRFVDENTILATPVDTQATADLIAGQTDSNIVDDYRGISVLSSYTPMNIEGLNWGLLAEIDEAEAFSSIGQLTSTIVIAVVAGSLLAIALAFFLARSVGRVLGADPTRLGEVVTAIANDDLTNDFSGEKSLTGVYEGIATMQRNLKDRIAADRAALQKNGRIRQALDTVDGNVLIADADNQIIYMNKAMTSLMHNAETEFRKTLPDFEAGEIMGRCIEQFYSSDSMHQVLGTLKTSHTSEVDLGERTIRMVTNPVFDDAGERLGTVVEWTDRTQEIGVEQEVAHVVGCALRGDLSKRIELQGKSGFFETLSTGVNDLVTISQRIIDDTVRVLSAIASGDLQETIDEDFEGSFGRLKQDANATVEKLTEVVTNIQSSAGSVKLAAGEISKGNADLSIRTERQAAKLGETTSSINEMTTTVRRNADNAAQANQLAKAAREQAEIGGSIVGQAVTAMEKINQSSNKISEIIGVIDEIAFQTNLLALNASVEAARAGDQGRGFAVVASEVRNLASRSAAAAKEIKDLIDDSGDKVKDGSRLVNESGETLQEIVAGVKKVTDIVGEIAGASQEQSEGISEVNETIVQMDELTQQNSALVEEAAAASESLGDQADHLDSLMAFFRVNGDKRERPQDESSAKHPDNLERRSGDRPWGPTKGDAYRPSNDVNDAAPDRLGQANGTDAEWAEF